MKRTRLALQCGTLLLALMLGGCSSGSETASADGAGMDAGGISDNAFPGAPGESMGEVATEDAPASLSGGEIAAQSQRKIIRNADFSLETLNYDQTVKDIEAMVQRCGGYVESSSTSGRSAIKVDGDDPSRWADYTVRIPADQLDSFGDQLAQYGSITSSHYSTQEVTDTYYDTEARLESLQLQEERLLDILSKAESLEEVITLESTLADVRYQIESLQGSLRRLDSLIALSTVNISVREVRQYTPEPGGGLGSRISAQFSRSVTGIRTAVENIIVFVVGNSLSILLLGGAAAAIAVAVRKRKRRNSAFAEQSRPVDRPEKDE